MSSFVLAEILKFLFFSGTLLSVVESEITAETLKETLEEYNFTTKVDVYLPKFKIEESVEVNLLT